MKKTRRRGKELEEAILNSTWTLLKEQGYDNLTMDSIAESAGTTKTVLYRRWDGKAEIIIAAAKQHLPEFKLTIPNTGSLREDLLELLSPSITFIEFLGMDTIQGVLRDRLQKVSLIDILSTISTGNALSPILDQLFTYAHERKEIDKTKLTSITQNLLIYLFINAVLIGNLDRKIMIHMIDDILLPAYHHTLDI